MHKNMLYKVEKLSLRLIYSQIDKGEKVIYIEIEVAPKPTITPMSNQFRFKI